MNYKLLTFLILLIPFFAEAQELQLTNIPFVSEAGGGVSGVVEGLFYLAIVVAGMFAVVKLVIAGAKYMMSDVVTTKQSALGDIKGAIIGLLLILGTVLILDTINDDITNANLAIDDIEFDFDDEDGECDPRSRSCEDYPPEGTVTGIDCNAVPGPGGGGCLDEENACRGGNTLPGREIGETQQYTLDGGLYIDCLPTGEYDRVAYNEPTDISTLTCGASHPFSQENRTMCNYENFVTDDCVGYATLTDASTAVCNEVSTGTTLDLESDDVVNYINSAGFDEDSIAEYINELERTFSENCPSGRVSNLSATERQCEE